ncbi:MAG: transposase [Chloroflexaceae bacterium]|jgi:putative transposase|nr:transposase [Chloroflexaceae bacterium]
MQLVERHVIKATDPRFAAIDAASFAAKNLYNAANYLMRQAFITGGERVLSYAQLYRAARHLPAYTGLPRKVAQQVLKSLQKNWVALQAARREWAVHPEKFRGKPGLPKYLDKQRGRYLLVYTVQALSRPALRQGRIAPSGLDITVTTRQTSVNQVRMVPKRTHYVVEVVYSKQPEPATRDPTRIAGLDLGINNLVTIAANTPGFIPVTVNGRPLKAINQWYNKRRAQLHARLPHGQFWSHQLDRLTDKRNRHIDHALHVASKRIIDLLVREGIGTLVIGYNPWWKQQVRLGTRNNQQFVQLPHARLIHMLTYKGELRGMRVIVHEESYTSKCSFLDNEPVGKHDQYLGRRVTRGLFRAADGRHSNADVNGAYNIIGKVAPDAFAQGRSGCVVHPVRLAA